MPQQSGTRACRRSQRWSLAALARLRSTLYGVLSLAYLPPDEHRLQVLRDVAIGLKAHRDLMAELAFYTPWMRLIAVLARQVICDVPLQEEHTRLFAVNPDGPVCFPYESAYLTDHGESPGLLIAEVARCYRTAGLEVAPKAHERADHVSVELEFMAYLCDAEALAWGRGSHDEARLALLQEQDFLHHHLGQWLSGFARAVSASTSNVFYKAVSEAADAFVQHDRDLLDQLLCHAFPPPSQPAQRSNVAATQVAWEVESWLL
jgi:TorA maturation chaperone TorD